MKNAAKMKKTGSRKSVKRKWQLFAVMIVHVGAGRLCVFLSRKSNLVDYLG